MATLREVLGLLARSSGGYSTRSSCLRRGLLLSRWGSITSTPTHCCCLSPAVQLPAGDRPYTSPAVDYIRPLSPAVRHLVDSHNINDLSSITATGPGQRLLKGDILQYIQDLRDGTVAQPAKEESVLEKPAQPVSPPPKRNTVKQALSSLSYTDLPLDENRVAAASRIAQYKITTPHTYASVSCMVDRIIEMNQARGTAKIDLTAFLVKAAALTLQRVPQSNAVWTHTGVEVLPSVNVSVLLPQGQFVAVSNADRDTLESISEIVKGASDDSSAAVSMEDCSISIFHLEAPNVTEIISVINPQQSSTLSIGSIQAAPNEQGSPSMYVNVTLTSDARVMDYELSCNWLDMFRRIVEAPDSNGLL